MDADLRDELREMLRQMARMSGEAKESVRGVIITKTAKASGGFDWLINQNGAWGAGHDTATTLHQFECALDELAARAVAARAEAGGYRG